MAQKFSFVCVSLKIISDTTNILLLFQSLVKEILVSKIIIKTFKLKFTREIFFILTVIFSFVSVDNGVNKNFYRS